MKIFISGGCKNGKSTFAQKLTKSLADGGALYYIATMEPRDGEDHARILRHIAEREGWGFRTLECPRNISGCINNIEAGGTFLLDSVTALLSNEMFPPPDYGIDIDAARRVSEGLLELGERADNIVYVSDYIYSDAAVYDGITETYRKGLAYVDRALVKSCDAAAELCAGIATWHKGYIKI
jgi:Adenosyl cobinamide kinase/adenosyl cobinamide phosphate guanylyltransferase